MQMQTLQNEKPCFRFGTQARIPTLKINTPTDFNVNLSSTFRDNLAPSFGIGERFRNQKSKI